MPHIPDPNRPWTLTDRPYNSWSDVNQSIKAMPDDRGLLFDKAGYDIITRPIDLDDIQKLNDLEGACHAICFASRPGNEPFHHYLEQKYFEPDTPANHQYQFRIFKWEGMHYTIATIPLDKKSLLFEAALYAGFKVQDGAIPFAVDGPVSIRASLNPNKSGSQDANTLIKEMTDLPGQHGVELFGEPKWFPLNCATASTIETAKNDDPLYGGPGGLQDAFHEADVKLKQILEASGLNWEDHLKRRKV